MFKLQELSNQLGAAYKGQDIQWIDEEEEEDKVEGSGGDYDEECGGSGDCEDYEGSVREDYDNTDIVVPDWHEKTKAPVGRFHPQQVTTTTTVRPVVGSGTNSVHLKSKWAVAKA